MPYNIDPRFSVYHLVERVQHVSVLVNQRRTMSIISREIENTTLEDGAYTRLFSSFQYLSRFLPQVERYRKLAAQSESVYVFGVPDVPVPAIPNLHYIYLTPQHQLTKEWFLISYGEDYACALATEEISRENVPDSERRFKGIWTFDESLVSILHDWLTNLVDAHPLPHEASLQHQTQMGYMMRSLHRLTTHVERGVSPHAAFELLTAMRRAVATAR
jgi:DICT domain-containing protein